MKEEDKIETIASVLAVYTSFILDLKPLVPGRILNQMIKTEIDLRLHLEELEEK